jgi:hypothetical protein
MAFSYFHGAATYTNFSTPSFYVYSRTTGGDEIRKHRNVSLGPKSRLKKWEAEKKLKENH